MITLLQTFLIIYLQLLSIRQHSFLILSTNRPTSTPSLPFSSPSSSLQLQIKNNSSQNLKNFDSTPSKTQTTSKNKFPKFCSNQPFHKACSRSQLTQRNTLSKRDFCRYSPQRLDCQILSLEHTYKHNSKLKFRKRRDFCYFQPFHRRCLNLNKKDNFYFHEKISSCLNSNANLNSNDAALKSASKSKISFGKNFSKLIFNSNTFSSFSKSKFTHVQYNQYVYLFTLLLLVIITLLIAFINVNAIYYRCLPATYDFLSFNSHQRRLIEQINELVNFPQISIDSEIKFLIEHNRFKILNKFLEKNKRYESDIRDLIRRNLVCVDLYEVCEVQVKFDKALNTRQKYDYSSHPSHILTFSSQKQLSTLKNKNSSLINSILNLINEKTNLISSLSTLHFSEYTRRLYQKILRIKFSYSLLLSINNFVGQDCLIDLKLLASTLKEWKLVDGGGVCVTDDCREQDLDFILDTRLFTESFSEFVAKFKKIAFLFDKLNNSISTSFSTSLSSQSKNTEIILSTEKQTNRFSEARVEALTYISKNFDLKEEKLLRERLIQCINQMYRREELEQQIKILMSYEEGGENTSYTKDIRLLNEASFSPSPHSNSDLNFVSNYDCDNTSTNSAYRNFHRSSNSSGRQSRELLKTVKHEKQITQYLMHTEQMQFKMALESLRQRQQKLEVLERQKFELEQAERQRACEFERHREKMAALDCNKVLMEQTNKILSERNNLKSQKMCDDRQHVYNTFRRQLKEIEQRFLICLYRIELLICFQYHFYRLINARINFQCSKMTQRFQPISFYGLLPPISINLSSFCTSFLRISLLFCCFFLLLLFKILSNLEAQLPFSFLKSKNFKKFSILSFFGILVLNHMRLLKYKWILPPFPIILVVLAVLLIQMNCFWFILPRFSQNPFNKSIKSNKTLNDTDSSSHKTPQLRHFLRQIFSLIGLICIIFVFRVYASSYIQNINTLVTQSSITNNPILENNAQRTLLNEKRTSILYSFGRFAQFKVSKNVRWIISRTRLR